MKSLPRPFAVLLMALLASPLSCATSGGPPPPSQPVARETLAPPLRVFYDALIDYGDWVLIEPYGYVFRPAINQTDWRPYNDGFWAPTDTYGWVWISAEPFGWATYHYGTWFYDRFQRWVWLPGIDWGPAWVAWEESNDYVGWAPAQYRGGQMVPTGPFVYAPVTSLGNTQVKTMLVTPKQMGEAASQLKPATNVEQRDGVAIPLGPSMTSIERRLGAPLTRAHVEDLVPGGVRTPAHTATPKGAAAPAPAPQIETTRRAGEEAARQARTLIQQPENPPTRLPIVRLGKGLAPAAHKGSAHRDSAAADTTH